MSKLWEHFTLKEGAPHRAICNICSKDLSRGKEGSKVLGNKTMSTHLKSQHPAAFKDYEVAKTNKIHDPKDETKRGSVPMFNLKNHGERAEFLALVSILLTAHCSLLLAPCSLGSGENCFFL